MKKFVVVKMLILILSLSLQAQENTEKKSFWESLTTFEKTSETHKPKSDSIVDKIKYRILVAKDKAVDIYKEYKAKQEVEDRTREVASQKQPEIVVDHEIPNFKSEGMEEKTAEFKKTKEQLKNIEVTSFKKGSEADANLKKSKSGVVSFDVFEKPKKGQKGEGKILSQIPYLNIGVEDQISSQSFTLNLPKVFELQNQKIKEIASPEVFREKDLVSFYNIPYEKVKEAEKLEKITLSLPEGISPATVKSIQLVIRDIKDIKELPFYVYTQDEVKFLKGIILAEYKEKCHVSTGLLKDANNIPADTKGLRDFFFNVCLFKMGLQTDSVPEIAEIIKSNNEYSKKAINIVLGDLKREYVPVIGEAFEVVNTTQVDPNRIDVFHYYRGLSRSIKKNFNGALEDALKVPFKSQKYFEAQYMAAISEYMLGKVGPSIERQEKLLIDMDKSNFRGTLKGLVKMNIGRAAYRSKQYKKAIDSYQFIGKENPLWIQALTEQGWMQILAGDAPGAIGNMHSIQIPQFKDIFKPESYAVRAIGYLNICQYGDAQKTLGHLEKVYAPWIRVMKEELNKQYFNYVFYENVIRALKGGENKTTLPQPLIREITRHRDFLNIQEAINNKIDEEAQFSFINGLIKKDEATAKSRKTAAEGRAKSLQGKINSAAKNPDTLKLVAQWRAERDFEIQTAEYYDFEIALIKESHENYREYQVIAKKNLEERKENFKSLAGKTMRARLASMRKKVEQLVANNEFLTYELFSGSGENIRFVASGGQVRGTSSTKESAKKEASGKLYLWDFDGEFWADEIGNYKSSLRDNCPKAGQLTEKVK